MVRSEPSDEDGGSGADNSTAPKSYSERFWEAFPAYLAMGMTEEQYWDKDPELVKYYRKAEEIRSEKRNQELWLQGMYFYEALLDVSPVLHAFVKKGTKPKEYSKYPYPITNKQREKVQEVERAAMQEKGKRYMEALMASTQKKFSR